MASKKPGKAPKKPAKAAKKGKKGGKGKAKRPELLVHLEVLQNGATLTKTTVPLRRSGSLTLTSSGDGPLALPHYPLPEGRLEFLRFSGDRITLVVDYKWEGFCTSKGELVNITRGDRGQRTLVLHKGDYASITYDNLRLLIKLAPPVKPEPERHGTARAYRRNFFAHFFPTQHERLAALVAAGLAGALVGGALIGLLARKSSRPHELADINEEYVLPFIAPDHLRYAPEALQSHLDRRQEVRNVLDYYDSVTDVLMSWPAPHASYLFPTTVDLYRDLHAEAEATIAAKTERQAVVDQAQKAKSDVAVLTIPAVLGETMAGSMLRVVDKIGIMEEGFRLNLEARRKMLGPDGAAYIWENYKNPVPKASADEKAVQALGSALRAPSDEQMMYAEAEALAQRAHRKQAPIERAEEAEQKILTPRTAAPVGLPDGVTYASFAPDVDFHEADGKFALLVGSPLGTHPAAKGPRPAKEPLVGEIEPALIERYIKENRFQLQLCYELALRRNEGAAGTMEWRWRIDSRGVISDVALVSSSIEDQRMTECVRRKISQWRFPRPRRGSVEVSYPFEFAPAKG